MKSLVSVLLLSLSIDSSTGFKKSGKNVSTPPRPKAALTRKLTSLDLAVAGSLATAIGDAALHPLDCIKTLQMSDEGIGLSMIAAGRKIFSDFGAGGFYSGLGTYVASDAGAGAFKFATYEALKIWVKDKVPEEYFGAAIFGCAAAAFIVSSSILVPGELIKSRLQMGQISTVSEGVSKIWKNEGIKGFYAGYSGVCLRDIPYTMLELGIYDNLKSFYLKYKRKRDPDGKINQMDEIIAAAITGGITGLLTTPTDNIKTKLMVDSGAYSGFLDCFRKTVADGGFGSLFQGGAARVSWLLPFTAIYLPVYEVFKRRLATFNVPNNYTLSSKTGYKEILKVKGGHIKPKWFRNKFERMGGDGKKAMRHSLDGGNCFVGF